MKKVLAISSVLLGVVFLAGCGQQQTSQTQPTTPVPVAQQPATNPPATIQPAPTTTNITPVPANWITYTDSRYGFELRLPSKPAKQASFVGSVTASGKTYQTIQLTDTGANEDAVGGLTIKIIKAWSNTSVDPYGNTQYPSEPQINLNGIAWNVFYNPKQDLAGCEGATFQTLMPNGKDMIVIDKGDSTQCPGNSAKSPSIAFLKQALSTFKFTK